MSNPDAWHKVPKKNRDVPDACSASSSNLSLTEELHSGGGAWPAADIRAKSLGVNPLDDIAGIGPTRKRALLKHFGSAKAVSRAGVDDLAAVDGISGEMARKIYDFFHEKRT